MAVIDTFVENELSYQTLKTHNHWNQFNGSRLLEKNALKQPWSFFSDPQESYSFQLSSEHSLYLPLTSVFHASDVDFQFDYIPTLFSLDAIGGNFALMAHQDLDSGQNWLDKKQLKEEQLSNGQFWSEQSHLRVHEVKFHDKNKLKVKYEKSDYLSFLLSNHHFRGSIQTSPTHQYNIHNKVTAYDSEGQHKTLFKASRYLQNELAVIGLIISVDWEGFVYVWLTNRSSNLLTNSGGISVSLSGAMGGANYDDSQYLEIIFKDKTEAQTTLKHWLRREPDLNHSHNFQHALGYSTFVHHLKGIDKKRVMKKLGAMFSFPFFRYQFSAPNPKLTFVRELFEETGVRLHPEHVTINQLFHQAYEQQLILSGFACFFGDRHEQLLQQLNIHYNANGHSSVFNEQENFVGLKLDEQGIGYLADLILECWWPPISLASLFESLNGFEEQWQEHYQKTFSKELQVLEALKEQLHLRII